MNRLFAIAVALALGAALPAQAQEYPSKQIRIVVPFPPGGGSDLIARVVAQKLAVSLGQPVVPDNRAGASGNIAAEIVAKSPADGYTLLFGNSSLSISPAVFKKLNYDPVRELLEHRGTDGQRRVAERGVAVRGGLGHILAAILRSAPARLSGTTGCPRETASSARRHAR